MHTTLAIVALAASASALTASAPASGCSASYDGSFQIEILSASAAKVKVCPASSVHWTLLTSSASIIYLRTIWSPHCLPLQRCFEGFAEQTRRGCCQLPIPIRRHPTIRCSLPIGIQHLQQWFFGSWRQLCFLCLHDLWWTRYRQLLQLVLSEHRWTMRPSLD